MTSMVKLELVIGGRSDLTILASGLGPGDTGGGLFAFNAQDAERVDYLSSTGLFVADDRLIRAVYSDPAAGSVGETPGLRPPGSRAHLRIDALAACHDVHWDGQCFVAVSTGSNAIHWISPAGEVVRTWRAPARGTPGTSTPWSSGMASSSFRPSGGSAATGIGHPRLARRPGSSSTWRRVRI